MTQRARPPIHLLAIFAALVVLASACGGSVEPAEGPAGNSDPPSSAAAFPRFSASTLDGGQLDFGALEGQDLALWFWAPW